MDHKNHKHHENAPSSSGRRKAVKTIVGGVTAIAAYNVLPVKWGTPIIEQVFLPAHAATSGSSLHDPCEVTWVSGYQDSNTVVIEVNGYVTPPTGDLPTTIVATGNPDATATSTVTTTTAADGTFSAQITLQTATGLGSVAVTTTVDGADGTANCSVDVPQQVPASLSCGDPLFPVPVDDKTNTLTISQNPWLGADDLSISNIRGHDNPRINYAFIYCNDDAISKTISIVDENIFKINKTDHIGLKEIVFYIT
jgi:hypothetical protein